jgi:hypothetical protein
MFCAAKAIGQADGQVGPVASGAEEREPHHGQHQNRQSERDGKQGNDRRSELALPSFSRRFDDPVLVSCCHDALKSASRCAGIRGRLVASRACNKATPNA